MSTRLDIRTPAHARILARAAQASPPPTSWWAQPHLTREQWSVIAAKRAQIMNAVTSTQHISRDGGFHDRTDV